MATIALSVRRWPVFSRRFLVLAVLALAAGRVAGGENTFLKDPTAFLRADGGLTATELVSVDHGRIVAKVLDTPDKSEVLSVAVMRLRASAAQVVAALKDVEGRRRDEEVLEIGRFGVKPSAHDLESLTLEARDVDGLRACQVGRCLVKLSAPCIERFRREIDWSSPKHAQAANTLWHELLANYTAEYLIRGNSALAEYRDDVRPVRIADSLGRLLARAGYLQDAAPDVLRYLQEFPDGRPPGAEDLVFWVKERFWVKHVLTLNHLTIVDRHNGPERVVLAASKQIYANHYFESSLGLTVFLDDGRRSPYLIFINRSRADIRPTGFNLIERLLLKRLVRGRLEAQLRAFRAKIEGPAPPIG